MKRNWKLILLLCMLSVMMIVLAGCGGTTEEKKELAPLKDVVGSVLPAEHGLIECGIYDLVDMIGIDEEKIADCVYLTSADGLSTEEVIVLRCKDKKHVKDIEKKLDTYLNQRMKETENYLPEVFKMLKDTKVQTKNSTVLFAVGANAAEWAKGILAGE